MPENKTKSKLSRPSQKTSDSQRIFENDSGLHALRLVIDQTSEDDFSGGQNTRFSSELIKNLIECIKKV
jgi:uncharacterized membrane protein